MTVKNSDFSVFLTVLDKLLVFVTLNSKNHLLWKRLSDHRSSPQAAGQSRTVWFFILQSHLIELGEEAVLRSGSLSEELTPCGCLPSIFCSCLQVSGCSSSKSVSFWQPWLPLLLSAYLGFLAQGGCRVPLIFYPKSVRRELVKRKIMGNLLWSPCMEAWSNVYGKPVTNRRIWLSLKAA